MIVITAPTGKIGHRVLDAVLADGSRPVRVIVRDPARLPDDVRDRAEVVRGSHGDPETVTRALDGAEALFWLLPTDFRAASLDEAFSGFARPAAEAVRSRGVKHVVAVSGLGRGTAHAGRAGFVTGALAVDGMMRDTGAAYRALAAGSFMDNVLRQLAPIKEQGTFYGTLSPSRRSPLVAARDIAAVAARLLLDTTWSGQQEVPLLGPEDLSQDDQAAIASEVLGTPVRYRQIPDAALKRQLLDDGASEAIAQGMLDMLTAKDAGLDAGITRTPQHAADTPTTFRDWCEQTLRPAVQSL